MRRKTLDSRDSLTGSAVTETRGFGTTLLGSSGKGSLGIAGSGRATATAGRSDAGAANSCGRTGEESDDGIRLSAVSVECANCSGASGSFALTGLFGLAVSVRGSEATSSNSLGSRLSRAGVALDACSGNGAGRPDGAAGVEGARKRTESASLPPG